MQNYQNQDHYRVLGVTRIATQAEIKKAWRKLVREHHEDKNPHNKANAHEKVIQLNLAYEVLGNEDKRRSYDRFGSSDVAEAMARAARAEAAKQEAQRRAEQAEQKIKEDFTEQYCKFYPWSSVEQAEEAYEKILSRSGMKGVQTETKLFKETISYSNEIDNLGLNSFRDRYKKCCGYYDAVSKDEGRAFRDSFNQTILRKSVFLEIFRQGGEAAINAKIPALQALIEEHEDIIKSLPKIKAQPVSYVERERLRKAEAASGMHSGGMCR